jgi:hypothetical protein
VTIQSIMPTSGLPRTRFFPGQTVNWLGGPDSPEALVRQGGHPLYGPADVTYQFNSHGYRCAEFESEAEIRLISIGCSITLGQALPQSVLFHERFAQCLRTELGKSVVNWNLSQAGASNDYISRVLQLIVPKLRPHIVLINFTYTGRREYVAAHNQQVEYIPSWTPEGPILKDIYRHFDALSSPHDNQLNFFRNYKSVEALLQNHQWLYSLTSHSDLQCISAHIDHGRYVGPMDKVDTGRDNMHPGPRSHELLFTHYWRRFVDLGMLDNARAGHAFALGRLNEF